VPGPGWRGTCSVVGKTGDGHGFVVNRPRTDGGISIQIKWRQGGEWESETFTNPRLASEFRSALEASGHH
jgi:hypothetical protein